MDKAKIMLSAKETQLVGNADWILTKNQILQKVKLILEDVQSKQQDFFKDHPAILPAEVITIPPKISRGENYKGLPWLVLDHPRFFGKEDHFAVRSMFWWGNFFSITLHLAGIYKRNYERKAVAGFSLLEDESFFIGVGDEQWEHHFETDNYLPLKEMNEESFKAHVTHKPFIKLAKKLSFEQWNETGDDLFISFRQLMLWLAD
ncbi:MAG TPA: hypothetical protein VFI06_05555 [Chitinophagaceae bacterium]|nr:hypothetical protein [Chitinophagaceae bacterium]